MMPWGEVPKILKRIKPPVFPARLSLSRALALCQTVAQIALKAFMTLLRHVTGGGGKVIVPAGRFLTGAIHCAEPR